jgi:hypothetical protein
MNSFPLWWEEILRFSRTHQVEQMDLLIAGGVGLAILLGIVLSTRRREDSPIVRDRWVLLAVESESQSQLLTEAFRKASWDVQLFPPYTSLGEFLSGFNPSLLVVDQARHGNELARLEASEAKVASTPILYLNANQVDRSAIPMRAWLPAKAKIKSILEQADKLARARPGNLQLSRKTEVRGPIGPGTLLELLYFQANTQRTGRMEISYHGLSGWLWIERGDVRHAMVAGIEGVEALQAMLNLVDGRFSFVADVPPPTTTIRTPTVFLLHEYARQRDELGKMAGN